MINYNIKEENTTQSKESSQSTKSSDQATYDENYSQLCEHTVVVQRKYYIVNTALWTDQGPFEWREYNRSDLDDSLLVAGFDKFASKRLLASLLADPTAKVVDQNHCMEALPLHPAGYQVIQGDPFYLKKARLPLQAVMGDPQPAIRMIVRMFHEEADLMLGWLQGAYKRQLNYVAKCRGEEPPYQEVASQTLCLAGLQDTGKTMGLLKCIVSVLLGDYEVIPTAWLVGKSQFADWQLRAPLYVCDDAPPITSLQERRMAARMLKQLGYPDKASIECKYKGAFSISFPNERYFACNMDPQSLRALPEISEADGDKYLVLHICAPCGKVEDYGDDPGLMQKTVTESIPAFAWWLLNEYTVPEWAAGTEGTRHTVANFGPGCGYVSPEIRRVLVELNSPGILMSKLRDVYSNAWLKERYVGKPLSLGDVRKALAEAKHEELCTDKELGTRLTQCSTTWPKLLSKVKNSTIRYTLLRTELWKEPLDAECAVRRELNPDLMAAAGLTEEDLASGAGEPEGSDLTKELPEPVTEVTENSGKEE